MHIQECKATDTKTGQSVYFFQHTFRSAYQHMKAYAERNSHLSLNLFTLNRRPFGPQWIKARA